MNVTSKIGNAMLLLHSKRVSKHIPKIQLLTPTNLSKMLQDFPSIYIKPNDSCRGKGILRVDQIHPTQYILRSRDSNSTSICRNIQDLWIAINQLKRNRFYVVQQGILSVTRSGHHCDIRVHMTRVHGKWLIAGMIGNIARAGGIITTESSGGVSVHVGYMLKKHLGYSHTQVKKTIQKIESVALHATRTISHNYPTWSEFGLDMGIDRKNNLWIFEVNITPGALVFQKLGKEAFHRILSLRKIAR